MRSSVRLGIVTIFAFVVLARGANGATITFESFADGEAVNGQIPELTFTNAVVLAAGISLNDFDFPPRSGANVLIDYSGEMAINFATPVSQVSGYFTYTTPVTLQAYGVGNTLLGSVTSAFGANFTSAGQGPPNELLGLVFATGIKTLLITGEPSGFSFALDDLTYTVEATGAPVPEPSTLILVGTGCAAVIRSRLNRRSRARSGSLDEARQT